MATTAVGAHIAQAEIVKIFQERVIVPLVWRTYALMGRHDPVFRWYVGHDPYNSADDQAFMDRLAPDA